MIGYQVEVKPSQIKHAGLGLYSKIVFRKGQAITEYDGKIIDWDQAKELREKKQATHVRTLVSQFYCIDGLKKPLVGRGGGSFCNDSRGSGFANNATFKKKYDSGGIRDQVFIVAKRDIEPGEEIFVSYGTGYWKEG